MLALPLPLPHCPARRGCDTGLARIFLSIGSSEPCSCPGRAVGRGSRSFPTKGARQRAGGSAGSQGQGQEPVRGSPERVPPLPLPAGDGGGRSPRCLPWGQRPAQTGGSWSPEPSSHRAPAAFHPGPDISTCRAFGKRHFNALAVKAVENVRGLVREGSREGATPWVCRALLSPARAAGLGWDAVEPQVSLGHPCNRSQLCLSRLFL